MAQTCQLSVSLPVSLGLGQGMQPELLATCILGWIRGTFPACRLKRYRMNDAGRLNLLWWAGREILRRPGHSGFVGACLAAVTAVVAVPLLYTQAVTETARELLAAGPAMVVRQVTPLGWRPLPAEEAVARALAVVGVTQATPRIWGIVGVGRSTTTVVALSPGDADAAPRARALGLSGAAAMEPPRRGEAIVGEALGISPGESLQLRGVSTARYRVRQVLGPTASTATRNLVFLHADDARRLLGLGVDHASDLAVSVYHPAEVDAMLPDLSEAFPFPVRITTRTEELDRYAGEAARGGGLAALMTVPALLGLALVVLAVAQEARSNRREVALLKALGWTTRDVAALHLLSASLIAVPSTAIGLALAVFVTFTPSAAGLGEVLLGVAIPPLTLTPSGASLVLLEVLALVVVPYCLAHLLPVLRQTATSIGHLFIQEPP